MSDFTDDDKANTIVLPSGSIEYSLSEAVTPIDALIEVLEQARDEGAKFVVASSGNWRGAQWASVSPEYGWADGDV